MPAVLTSHIYPPPHLLFTLTDLPYCRSSINQFDKHLVGSFSKDGFFFQQTNILQRFRLENKLNHNNLLKCLVDEVSLCATASCLVFKLPVQINKTMGKFVPAVLFPHLGCFKNCDHCNIGSWFDMSSTRLQTLQLTDLT